LLSFCKPAGAQDGDASSLVKIYCLPCREPKEPAGGIAEYVPLTDARGNLRGICPACDRLIHRVVSRASLRTVGGKLDITLTEPSASIRKTIRPSVDCDFKRDGDL
jgi:hypothetical protein